MVDKNRGLQMIKMAWEPYPPLIEKYFYLLYFFVFVELLTLDVIVCVFSCQTQLSGFILSGK